MYAAQVIIGLGGIIYPVLCEKMMQSYGFRGKILTKRYLDGRFAVTFTCHMSFFPSGTAAIVGALSLNSVVGMIMMHPVEWHARKPEEVLAERARAREEKYREHCLALSNRRSTIDVIHVSSKAKWSSLRSLKEESDKEVSLLIEATKVI